MRMRKKPNLAQRMAKCSNLLIDDPVVLRGQWHINFPQYPEIHLEIGCGKGKFTAETACETPGVFIIALEKSADAMVIALERANDQNLQNVRFINALADNLAQYFAPGEVLRIYLNFCDPWPANRHAKRRLTHSGFLEIYKQILAPGGEIHFKTDNSPLFEFSLTEFERCGFSVSEITRNLHERGTVGVMTDYEAKFHSQGIAINRCVAIPFDNQSR